MMTDTKKETPSTPTKAPDEVKMKRGKPFSLKSYHKKEDLSTPLPKKHHSEWFEDKQCARCGKRFIPTKPEYAWGEYCSYSCYLHRNNSKKILHGKPVEQLTDGGILIATFPSAVEAAKFIGIKKADNIRNCCNGKTKTSGGYVWRWKEKEQ